MQCVLPNGRTPQLVEKVHFQQLNRAKKLQFLKGVLKIGRKKHYMQSENKRNFFNADLK